MECPPHNIWRGGGKWMYPPHSFVHRGMGPTHNKLHRGNDAEAEFQQAAKIDHNQQRILCSLFTIYFLPVPSVCLFTGTLLLFLLNELILLIQIFSAFSEQPVLLLCPEEANILTASSSFADKTAANQTVAATQIAPRKTFADESVAD